MSNLNIHRESFVFFCEKKEKRIVIIFLDVTLFILALVLEM